MTEQEAIIFIQNAMEQSRKALAELMLLNPQLFKEKSKILGEYYSNLENCKKEMESCKVAIKALEEVRQYREIGTIEEIRANMEELKRWHTDKTNPKIKNVFANTSTLICHNCDHKDDYIEDLQDYIEKLGTEIDEYRAIGTVEECRAEVEKQIAAKPLGGKDIEGNEYAICRECSAILSDGEWFAQYCPDCGKKVDWREKEQG